MWWNLLDAAADTSGTTGTAGSTPGDGWFLYVFIGIVVVAFVIYMLFSGKKNKARQQEYIEQLEAIRPGHKVKTAGGICGVVVEVCDDNTVIIETGSENSGKSYVKMDKELIAQTDAKGPTQIAREEAEARRKAEKEAKEAAKRGEKTDAAQPSAEADEAKKEDAPQETSAEEAPAAEQAEAPSGEEK